MPKSLMSIKEVAESLHVSTSEVLRMAEQRILPAVRIKGVWKFRTGEVWNWIEQNFQTLPDRRRKDRHPEAKGGLLISHALRVPGVALDVMAKTKSSVLREFPRLAAAVDPYVDPDALLEGLLEREAQGSTALQDGVAVPHPARPLYSEGPIVAAIRTPQGIFFGEQRGGLTDLFFLICCPGQTEHLLHLGRLCRLLLDESLQEELRAVESPSDFADAIHRAESALCGVG